MVAGRWKKETRTYSTAIMQASFPLFISPVSPSLDSKVETVNQIHEEKAPEKPSISGLRSKKGAPMEWGKSPGPFCFSLSLQSRPPSNTRSALVAMAAAPRQAPKAPKNPLL